MSRDHVVRVRLNDQELAALDSAAAEAGTTRARLLRELIVSGEADAGSVPNRRETLTLMASKARAGNVAAMTALARELRLVPLEVEADEPVVDEPADELARLRALHAKARGGAGTVGSATERG